MVSSWKESRKYILEPVLENICKPRDSEDTLVLVSVEEHSKAECQPRSFGSEGNVFWDDFWRSIELPRRLTEPFTISFILPQKVINSRTELSWLRLSSNKRIRRSRTTNLRLNKKLEDKKIKKGEKREPKSNRDFD